MKKLLLFSMLIGSSAFGACPFLGKKCKEPPTWLKDAMITVTLANGEIKYYDANHWQISQRVLRRRAKRRACPKLTSVAAKACDPVIKWRDSPPKIVEKIVEKKIAVYKKNVFHFGIGFGPVGLKTNIVQQGDKRVFDIVPDNDFLGTIQYSRFLTQRWSLSGQFISDRFLEAKTGLFLVGFGF